MTDGKRMKVQGRRTLKTTGAPKSPSTKPRIYKQPYQATGKEYTPNGAREVARRQRQIKAGQLEFWKDGQFWRYPRVP